MPTPRAIVITVAATSVLGAVVGCSSSPTAPDTGTALTIPLANSGTQTFLTPFPNIEIEGASTQALVTPARRGAFAYDLTEHVIQPNPNSLVTGTVTVDFGAAGAFWATVTGDAISGASADIAGIRTTVTTVPVTFAKGTPQQSRLG